MTNEFPHSPAYLARQDKRQKLLDDLRQRLSWTDAQFLAERDATYVAEKRAQLPFMIAGTEREMKDDDDSEGYVAFYHTDEG